MVTLLVKKRIPALSMSYSILITLEYSAYCIFQQLGTICDSCRLLYILTQAQWRSTSLQACTIPWLHKVGV